MRCDKPWVAHYNLYRMVDHPTQIQELEVHLKIPFCPASLAEARSKLETRKAWWRCWNCRTSTSFTNVATPRRFRLEIWHDIEHWLMQQEEQKWENKTDSSHFTSEAWWNKMSSPSSAKIHCTCFQWMGSVSKRSCRWTATKAMLPKWKHPVQMATWWAKACDMLSLRRNNVARSWRWNQLITQRSKPGIQQILFTGSELHIFCVFCFRRFAFWSVVVSNRFMTVLVQHRLSTSELPWVSSSCTKNCLDGRQPVGVWMPSNVA